MNILKDAEVHALFTKLLIDMPPHSKILQIGANDGKSYDPVYKVIRDREDIHITLVEPIPEYFKYLVKNYEYRESVSFLNVAISDSNGVATLRYIPVTEIKPNNLPHWARGIATMEKNRNAMDETYRDFKREIHLDKARSHAFAKATKIHTGPLVSINQLMSHPFHQDTDVLVTDCEGHDATILLALNIELCAPSLIFSEWNLMSSKNQINIQKKLKDYSFYAGYENFLAVKKDAHGL